MALAAARLMAEVQAAVMPFLAGTAEFDGTEPRLLLTTFVAAKRAIA
jgi:hypothetical protein